MRHPMKLCLWLICTIALGSAEIAVGAEDASKTIVLIGGAKSHGPVEHDFPNGIQLLKDFLGSSPDIQALKNVSVHAYPEGWPKDETVLQNASTIVWYFDGVEVHPLLDANRRALFERLMMKDIGLVTLHQASTLPQDDKSIDLLKWLGGARYGKFDRTVEMIEFKPAAHPISRGVGSFAYLDEFYPTIRYSDKVVPILTGKLHVQFQQGQPIVTTPAELRPVAWAFERPAGGRSFGFTGLHYLVGLDQPQLRKLLLNAIVWTARIDVPMSGVRSGMPDAATRIKEEAEGAVRKTMTEAVVHRAADYKAIEYPWGRLTWYASRELKNSDSMTVGQAVIGPGLENPRHFHPNCDEILHVVKGRILHTMDERQVEMHAGDIVSIPMGVKHNAKNIGTEDAVLAISFSSADRQVIGE